MSLFRTRFVVVALGALIVSLALLAPRFLGIHTVPVPKGPQPQYTVADLQAALTTALRNDGVNYDALYRGRDPLLRFVQAMSSHGPNSAPEAFLTRPERLAYYLNAYNALVLYGVLVHRPQTSVQDVRGPIEPTAGFGFFWAQRFELDNDQVNLYDLENEVIRGFGDARIHAAINCASKSCPALQPEPFMAETLNAQLDAATRQWVASGDHVVVSPSAIRLSAIFDWFHEDFEKHAKSLRVGDGMLDWIEHFLPEDLLVAFVSARKKDLPVEYLPYDWSLNRSRTSTTNSNGTL